MKRLLLPGLIVCLLFCSSVLEAYYYGQNKVNSQYVKWSTIETRHFDIHFPAGNDEFGRLAALMAEETYYYLKQDLRFPAIGRIPIIFYGSQMEFQTTNIIYPLLSEGVGGFTESLRNRVAIPFDGSYVKLEQTLTHELTHAYINALDTGSPGSFFYLKTLNFPFWFSEGLPEFESLGGTGAQNHAYIIDLIMNDRPISLSESSGYSSYRLGESFLAFLSKRYGRPKVMDYLFTLRSINDTDKATEKVFGLGFSDLEERWKSQLKRDYYSFITSNQIPGEYSDRKTNHREEGSYFNLAPRFSPDGQKFIWFSNRNGRFSIWAGGLHEQSPSRKLIRGETAGNMEEFHYLQSNLAWFPDSRRFAYAAKTSDGDRICIADFDKAAVIEQICLPGIKAIYELDISPDGKSLVFSGQHEMQADLFLYDLQSGQLSQLTYDKYYDYQPRFSPDGSSVAFASERTSGGSDFRQGFFSDLDSNIYTLDLQDNSFTQITFGGHNSYHPVWDSTGTSLFFISERDTLANLETIELRTGRQARITKVLSGIYGFDLNPNGQYLVYSCYFNRGWNIYLKLGPLQGLNYEQGELPRSADIRDGLMNRIDLSRLDLYGRQAWHKPVTDGGPQFVAKNPTLIDFHPGADSLKPEPDFSWDDKPDSVSVIPTVKPYRVRFKLDTLFGGMAYSSSMGTIGSLELGMSDLLGNNAIGISLGLNGKIMDSNLLLTYLYLPRRIDHGIGAFNLFDEILYYDGSTDDYYRERTRETGLYYLMRYPFNKFVRLDLENQLYSWEYHWDSWLDLAGTGNDHWENDSFYQNGQLVGTVPARDDLIYAPALTLVQDNALYGSTGPLLGWRAFLTMRKSFARHKNDYQTAYLDLRSYTLFSKRYSFAIRLVYGASGGRQPQKFGLNGYYGIRGYEDEVEGENIALASAELRFPFLDYLSLAFPLPLVMSSVRGSVFADLGSVWDKTSALQGMQDEKLKDLHLGFGFGPRFNIGFAVLKFDLAWLTDLSAISRPVYYLSLTEDF